MPVAVHLVEQGGIGGLADPDSDSESESSLGGPEGWGAVGINFLGSLEVPCWKKGSLLPFACLYSRTYLARHL